jgi:hypothetical protein
MNTIGHAIFLVVGLTALALGGLAVVRKLLKKEMLETNLSAAEAMLGVVGTLFSVLLGFLVAGAIDRYSDAQTHAEQEANGVAAIFRMARGLSDEDRPRLRQLCREYVNQVLDVEWQLMEDKKKINHGWEPYQKLWEGVVSIVPENDRQSNIQQSITPAMQQVGEHRRARIIASQYTMSGALWIVIGFGALITIAFTYVFASQFPGVQDLMTGLVAASLALNIWLLAAYSSPFSGELQIQPKMFSLMKDDVLPVPDTPSRYLHDPKIK